MSAIEVSRLRLGTVGILESSEEWIHDHVVNRVEEWFFYTVSSEPKTTREVIGKGHGLELVVSRQNTTDSCFGHADTTSIKQNQVLDVLAEGQSRFLMC